jgi:hypothetical protein
MWISEWDTCASQAVVEAAGGEVLQAGGGVRSHAAVVLLPSVWSDMTHIMYLSFTEGVLTGTACGIQQARAAQPLLCRIWQTNALRCTNRS